MYIIYISQANLRVLLDSVLILVLDLDGADLGRVELSRLIARIFGSDLLRVNASPLDLDRLVVDLDLDLDLDSDLLSPFNNFSIDSYPIL